MSDPIRIEAARRRKILYGGLRNVISDGQLVQVIEHYEREFATQQPFSVQKIVSWLLNSQYIDAAKVGGNQLFSTLLRLSTQSVESLGPDPLSRNGTAPPSAPAPVARASGDSAAPMAMFQAIIQQLIEPWQQSNPGLVSALAMQLANQLDRLEVSAANRDEVRRWFAGRMQSMLSNRLTKAELSAILHAIYVWSCERFGPAESDRLWNRVLRECERHPAATACPPRSLL